MISASLHLHILANTTRGAQPVCPTFLFVIKLILFTSVLHTEQITFPSFERSCASFALKLLTFPILSSHSDNIVKRARDKRMCVYLS